MKRISLLCLYLCTAAWISGCCHSYYSRNSDCGDGYCCNHARKQPKCRRCKGDKCSGNNRQDCGDYAGGDCCCDQCGGDGGCTGGPMMQGAGCAGGNCAQGMPTNGCASGNCGGNGGSTTSSNTPMYSGMPFNPGDGWTVQSTTSQPIGNEPYPVPANSVPTPVTPSSSSQGWSTPSSVPNPAPVPPPVSFNRR